MKKVNFGKLPTEVKIGEFKDMDYRHQIGDLILVNAVTNPMSVLCKKIYYSKDDEIVEMEDSDFDQMMDILKNNKVLMVVREAIQRNADENAKIDAKEAEAEKKRQAK